MTLSLAKAQCTGVERRACFLLGFPIDLDKLELRNEIQNLGCKDIVNMEYISRTQGVVTDYEVQRKALECEFAKEDDVNMLLTSDLMVRKRNILVLPKIRDLTIEQMTS